MRSWLLILMLVLAPLRGMAAEGSAGSHHGAATGAGVASRTAAAVDPSGHGATDARRAHTAQVRTGCDLPACADAPAHAHGDSGACQACSGALPARQALLPAFEPVAHGLPWIAGERFSSREPAPGFKPPIC